MQSLKDKINELEQTNLEGLERAKQLSLREQEAIYAQRHYESEKFNEFKRIISGQRYFRIKHLQDLNIPYNIAIHLSAKNVGKTTELYRLISECLSRNKKFIYGRVTVGELETEIEKFGEDSLSPVILVKNYYRYYFFKKEDVETFNALNPDVLPTYSKLIKMGFEVVGKGMTFMGANTLGSGNYEDYEMIFFDEIVSYTPKQYVNERILYNWGVAISTILRNKSNLTVIMMGNLQNNITSVPILKYYGIDIGDNLRIIKRSMGGGEPCTILYVNSGSLYNNALKNQASVAHHASLDDRLFMEHNKIINSNAKVLNSAIVGDMESLFACAVELKDVMYALELRCYTPNDVEKQLDDTNIFALVVHPLTITTALPCDIYTHDGLVANKFTKTVYKKNLRSFLKTIHNLYIHRQLYFADARSMEIGGLCIDKVVEVYLNKTKPKVKMR